MKIAVVGGGPGGMMAAIKAAEEAEVHLFEGQESLGQKLLLTGGGRCNLCHDKDPEDFFAHVVNNPRFLYSAYYAFPKESLMAFFEGAGLPLKGEAGKVFPKSDRAEDILEVLIEKLKEKSVHIHCREKVGKIEVGEKFRLRAHPEEFDRVILACGGKTYPHTGSDGNGYGLAESLGIRTVPPVAGLVGLALKRPLSTLQGISLDSVRLQAGGHEVVGGLLFTHFGLSGPAALHLSSLINREQVENLTIDYLPEINEEVLRERILAAAAESPKRAVSTFLSTLLPKSLVYVLMDDAHVPEKQVLGQMTKTERVSIINVLKNHEILYAGLFSERTGIITAGGVDVREIDPRTMESKKVPGLYFAGEMIDVDALTGGYNLQIAFSTGFLAGKSALK